MPYIHQLARDELERNIRRPESAGELNYCFTRIAIEYFKSRGGDYQSINDIIGALEGAKQEFYRRVAAPYEAQKIAENGDVY